MAAATALDLPVDGRHAGRHRAPRVRAAGRFDELPSASAIDSKRGASAPSSGFSRAGLINAAVMGALSPRTVPALQAPAAGFRPLAPFAHESVCDRYKARIVEVGGVLVERALITCIGTVARLATSGLLRIARHLAGAIEQLGYDQVQLRIGLGIKLAVGDDVADFLL